MLAWTEQGSFVLLVEWWVSTHKPTTDYELLSDEVSQAWLEDHQSTPQIHCLDCEQNRLSMRLKLKKLEQL